MSSNRPLRKAVMQVILLAFWMSSSLDTNATTLTPQQVYASVSPSVWRVQTYDDDGLALSIGTAIVISPNTLVTNCHVLEKAKKVVVRQGSRSVDASLVLWDPERDICQLKAANLSSPSVEMGEVNQLQVGQNVFALGNPKGLDLTMSAGLLSSIRKNQLGQVVLLQTSAPISRGSSGGGLFDEQGLLIGLTTLGSTGDAQNLNFAVPVDWIKELQQRHTKINGRIEVATAPTESAVPKPLTAPVVSNNQPKNAGPQGCIGAANWPVPPLPTEEAVIDASLLPNSTSRMREEYRVFLSCPLPRAFAISETGKWWYAWSDRPADKTAPRNPIARALQNCEKSSGSHCFLYAVDNRIVYQKEPSQLN